MIGNSARRAIARSSVVGLISVALTAGIPVGLAEFSPAVAATSTVLDSSLSQVRWVKSPDGFANVRSGAGVRFQILRRLNNCATVTVVETKNGWSRLSSGGWVANSLLSSTSAGCTTPSPTPSLKQTCRVTVGSFLKADDARKLSSEIGGGAFVRQVDSRWVVQVGSYALRSNAVTRAAQFKDATITCTAT